MIKDLKYRINKKGCIYSHERITVVCDKCNKEWNTDYSNYKRRLSDIDMCQSCKNRFGICGMKGKYHNETTKKILSKKCKAFLGKSHSIDQKLKWSKDRKNRNCKGRSPTENEKRHMSSVTKDIWDNMTDEEKKYKTRGLLSVLKKLQKSGGKYSGLHNTVKNQMLKIGLTSFKSEEYINGYFADEIDIEHKIVIEVNGDYWHANPKYYNENDTIIFPGGHKTLVKDIWNHDSKKRQALINDGYKVYVLWEDDICKNNHLDTLKDIYGVIENAKIMQDSCRGMREPSRKFRSSHRNDKNG